MEGEGKVIFWGLSSGSGVDQMYFPSPFPSWNSWIDCCQILEIKLLLYLQIW